MFTTTTTTVIATAGTTVFAHERRHHHRRQCQKQPYIRERNGQQSDRHRYGAAYINLYAHTHAHTYAGSFRTRYMSTTSIGQLERGANAALQAEAQPGMWLIKIGDIYIYIYITFQFLSNVN